MDQTGGTASAQGGRCSGSLLYAVLALGAVVFALPFLWMVSTAFKPPWQVMIFPPQWIPAEIWWPNFTDSWGALDFGVFYRNTVFVTRDEHRGHADLDFVGGVCVCPAALPRTQHRSSWLCSAR